MYLLAVDPGVQTGVALLNPQGEIVWTLTCAHPFEELRGALRQYKDAEVAYEEAPQTRHHQVSFNAVKQILLDERPFAFVVRPSQWKSHPLCQCTDAELSGFETKHEAEAVGIGRWHLRVRSTTDVASHDPAGANA